MNLEQLKKEKENRVTALIAACSMFFAFSDKQFEEGKTPLQEGEKYVSLGAGCYMPKSKVSVWIAGTDEIDKWYSDSVRDSKLRKENIEYELRNHEAGYTGDIDDTMDALGSEYSAKEVREVLNAMDAN